MKLSSPILIKQFAETLQEQYPDLSEQQVKDICQSNFEYIRESMGSGKLPVIRQKYFGTFMAYPNRVKGTIKKLKAVYDKGRIGKEKFEEMYNNLQTYLDGHKKTN